MQVVQITAWADLALALHLDFVMNYHFRINLCSVPIYGDRPQPRHFLQFRICSIACIRTVLTSGSTHTYRMIGHNRAILPSITEVCGYYRL